MVQCPRCGDQVTGKFCPSCGSQMIPAPPPTAAAMMQPGQGAMPQALPPKPPGYPAQAPYQQVPPAPRRGGGVLKAILILLGVVVGLFVLLVVAGLLLSDDTGPASNPAAASSLAVGTVGKPIITNQVDEVTQAPENALKVVAPDTSEIFAAIEVNLRTGQVLVGRWYYNGRHQAHLDTRIELDKAHQGWASFNIGNGTEAWPPGTYKFELLLDGKVQTETEFSVK